MDMWPSGKVWMLRLRHVGLVDHCVCVDSKMGLTYDGEEAFPIRLTPESLALCGGDGASKFRIAEVLPILVVSPK